MEKDKTTANHPFLFFARKELTPKPQLKVKEVCVYITPPNILLEWILVAVTLKHTLHLKLTTEPLTKTSDYMKTMSWLLYAIVFAFGLGGAFPVQAGVIKEYRVMLQQKGWHMCTLQGIGVAGFFVLNILSRNCLIETLNMSSSVLIKDYAPLNSLHVSVPSFHFNPPGIGTSPLSPALSVSAKTVQQYV